MERVFATCVIGLTLLLGGCAHAHVTFYRPDGTECAVLKSTVLGTGETAFFVVDEECNISMGYDTKDTGLSDNATELGGKIAEGLAKGAVKGIVPVP